MKQAWKNWAVDLIKKTKRCPGECPSFGSPDDVMTEEEFQMTVRSAGTHPYRDCHWVDEVIGVPMPGDMKVLDGHAAKEPSEEDLQKVSNLDNEQTLSVLRQNLHVYVDQIRFTKPETSDTPALLYIPPALLSLEGYVKKFFDTDED